MVITKKTMYYFQYLRNILNTCIYGLKLNKNHIYIYTNIKKLIRCLTFLKYNTICKLSCLMDIVVIDNLNLKNRFEITYFFWNIVYEYKIGIKIYNNGYNSIYSLSNLYNSAIWLEREIWDMFGIKILMHKGLRRILTDYGFNGYPLRKDYPLVGYLDIYYDDATQTIKYNPIELTQNLRFFYFNNPWSKWYL